MNIEGCHSSKGGKLDEIRRHNEQTPARTRINGWNFWIVVMVLLTIPQILINIRGVRLTAMLICPSSGISLEYVCLPD
jgi:hypothetical protein